MTWLTNEIKYEGLPLLLRWPKYSNITEYQHRLTKLVAIEHNLEIVAANGLPEAAYNKTLADFDHFMSTYFETSEDGTILFVETFSGMRNYYYYTLPDFNAAVLIEQAQSQFKVDLDSWSKDDPQWDFIDKYPVKIF